MRALLAILIGIVGVTLAGCGDVWDGHVYPDKTDLTQSEYVDLSRHCVAPGEEAREFLPAHRPRAAR